MEDYTDLKVKEAIKQKTMTDIKPYLHYYINTGAEVEIILKGDSKPLRVNLMPSMNLWEFLDYDQVESIRFTNLIRVDELTDEQKVKLYDAIYEGNNHRQTDKTLFFEMGEYLQAYSPQLFHELLKLRVDLFNLMT